MPSFRYPSAADVEAFDYSKADNHQIRAWRHFEPLHALHGTWEHGEPTPHSRPDLTTISGYLGANPGPLGGETSRLIRARKLEADHPDNRVERHRTRQRGPSYDANAVSRAITGRATPIGLDPRELHGTQSGAPNTAALKYYMERGEDYRIPFAEQDKSHNQIPVVYQNKEGKNLILSGHHRAKAALLQGRQFMARHVTGEV